MNIALLVGLEPPRRVRTHTLALAGALARAGAEVTVWQLGGTTDADAPAGPAVRLRSVPFPDVPGEDDGARTRRAVAELGMEGEEAAMRAALVATQISGLAVVRYVLKVEPVAGADPEDLVRAVGPTVQRYLTGDLF